MRPARRSTQDRGDRVASVSACIGEVRLDSFTRPAVMCGASISSSTAERDPSVRGTDFDTFPSPGFKSGSFVAASVSG